MKSRGKGLMLFKPIAVMAVVLSLAGGVPVKALAFDPAAAQAESQVSNIEQRVSRAIASAYTQDAEALDEEYLFFKSIDNFLREHGQAPTGLSDNILDLTVSTITDRDAFIEAQRKLLKEGPDLELRERVNIRLKDEIASADSLLVADRYNRFTYLFNTFVRPLSLLTIGYFPALIDSGMATLLNVNKFTELSVEEKKALVLYERFLKKYPESDKSELLRRRVTNLNKKRINSCYQRELAMAGKMLSEEKFWQAQQYYKNALAYCPDGREATEGLTLSREFELKKNRLKMKTLEPADKLREFSDHVDDRDYQEIIYATLSGSAEMMIYEAEDYISRYPRGEYFPYALYAIAVAHDMKGVHDKAKYLMQEIADNYPDNHIGKHAAAYLASSDYNLLLQFKHSRKRHGLQSMRYVLFGPGFAKSNIILGSSRFITQGLQALQSLGIFNVVAMMGRALSTAMRNPIPDQEVIGNGLKYLRRYPDSPDSPEIHLLIARAYAKRKNLSKSVYHFEASGRMSEKKLVGLREKAAKQYLDFAVATESKNEKIRCYETILEEYPLTNAAVKALEQLALLERVEEPLFLIDKQTISENPILFKLTGLHLGPHLLDGDQGNGEVSSKGIYSSRRGKVTIVYKEGKEERKETVNINYSTYKGLLAFAEEIEYQKRLGESGTGVRGGRFPVEIRGTIGDDGVFVYPRLKARPYKGKDLYLYQ